VKFRIEIVTDAARFAALRDVWQHLWTSTGGYIFQSHDWITGWLTGMQDRREMRLRIALAWDGNHLAAVMPCAVHRRRGLRVLHFAAQLFSDYCDCLIAPNHDPTVMVPLLWDSLRQVGGFDLISLQQVRADARCRGFFDALAGGDTSWRIEPQERCLRIDNQWPNGTVFFRSLNKKARNNHTRGKRILTELGGEVSFRVIEPDQPIDAVVDQMLRLKEDWLRINDPGSPLFGPDGAVLRMVIDHAWRSGLMKIFVLECGGRTAAVSVNFVYGGRMEAYFTAYDAAFERASPGTILIVEYAQWSFDRGLTLVDFLRGEEAFKFRMANAETKLSTIIGPKTLLGHIAVSGHRWLSRRRQRSVAPETKPQVELEAAD